MAHKKLLIVEDNEEVLQLIYNKLQDAGYEAVKISKGGEVVTKALEFHPDLILMDIMLPDIDGADAVKLLQENTQTQDIPVLFMSGIVMNEEDKIPTIKVGEQTYPAISKPFTFKDLISRIQEIVG